MNAKIKQKLKQLPKNPGVYLHKSQSGEIIYVGKAAVLKNRVPQYFQESRPKDNKTMALVAEIDDFDWLETESEIDALFLESELIKRYMPRYNVLLRDDRSSTYIRIDMKSVWPTVTLTRNPGDDGAEYFGPFYNGFAIKRALRYLRRIFPFLTKPRRPGQSKLDEDLGLSPKFSEGSDEYKANLRKLISYIKGNRKKIMVEIEKEMLSQAKNQNFEQAAKLRNKLSVIKSLQNKVMFGDREFLNISKDQALVDLRDLFGLGKIPARIEGFDISHMSGKEVVASMVVFVNGVSSRADYRKFKVTEKNDDAGNIYETIFRRFSQKNIASWGKPDLIFIDGGKGQVDAAIKALKERQQKIPIVGIAKRDEEIIIHKQDSQINFDKILSFVDGHEPSVRVFDEGNFYALNLHAQQKNAGGHSKNLRHNDVQNLYSDVILLFQRVRDESHRFAINYHTALKRSRTTSSSLDSVPGIGPVTRKKILKEFGSTAEVFRRPKADLIQLIGKEKAEAVWQNLGGKK